MLRLLFPNSMRTARSQSVRRILHVDFAANVGIDRYHVISIVHLHAVAGIVEEADRTGLLRPSPKSRIAVKNPVATQVSLPRHLKAQIFELGFDRFGIVFRTAERPGRVGAVADDQRDPRLGARRPGQSDGSDGQQQYADEHAPPFHFLIASTRVLANSASVSWLELVQLAASLIA